MKTLEDQSGDEATVFRWEDPPRGRTPPIPHTCS